MANHTAKSHAEHRKISAQSGPEVLSLVLVFAVQTHAAALHPRRAIIGLGTTLANVNAGYGIHCEIKQMKSRSWDKLHRDCGFLSLISGCTLVDASGDGYLRTRSGPWLRSGAQRRCP
eukprot:176246-Rhodomonas_salina.3